MPKFEFTSPEGKSFEMEGPEGSTKEQAFQKFKELKPELFAAPPKKEQPSTFGDVLTGAKAAIMEPVYGLGEFVPGEIGKKSAQAAKDLESEYERATERSPIATRAGYFPTAIATLFGPGVAGKALGYVPKVAEAASAAGKIATAGREGAITGGAFGALSPTGEQDIGERYKEKAVAAGLGSLLGGVLGLGIQGGLSGSSAAKSYLNTALGRPATKAEEDLIQKATSAAEGRASALTAEEKSKLADLERETQRKATAEKTATKAQKEESEAAKGLAGARIGEEFGQYGVVTETKDQIGNYLRSQAENFINSIKGIRGEKANVEIAAARDAAKLKEASGNNFVVSEPMNEVKSYIEKKLATETDPNLVRQLEDLSRSLLVGTEKAAPTFESAETIRRKLGDAAFGVPEEGYAAIGQGVAKELYGKLSDAMKAFEPKFGPYLERYKRLSENIEASGSKLGKALVGVEKDAPSYYGATAQSITDKAFSSPENVRTLIDALGGNKQPVLAAAERYFANELATKGTAEKARQFLTSDKTRSLLNELGPEFRKTIQDKFLAQAQKQSARANALREQITKSNEVITGIEEGLKDVRKRSGTLNKGLEEIKNAVSSQAKTKAASSLITDLQSEVSPQEYAALKNQIEQYVAAEKAKGEARKTLAQGVTAIGLTGLLGYAGRGAVSRYLGD